MKELQPISGVAGASGASGARSKEKNQAAERVVTPALQVVPVDSVEVEPVRESESVDVATYGKNGAPEFVVVSESSGSSGISKSYASTQQGSSTVKMMVKSWISDAKLSAAQKAHLEKVTETQFSGARNSQEEYEAAAIVLGMIDRCQEQNKLANSLS